MAPRALLRWLAPYTLASLAVSARVAEDGDRGGVAAEAQRLGKSAGTLREYIRMMAVDAHGQPNSRVLCSEGNKLARTKIAHEMGALGLVPLGDDGTFEFAVTPPMGAAACEAGIANLIGYVKGTELPDEYILYMGHHDGVNVARSSNVYDDASAVAVGLALAGEFAGRPAKRSIIFLFTDGEEEGLVGMTGWVQHPTVDLSKIKLAFSADPLGAPGIGGHDLVAVLGTETTPGLRELLLSAWPAGEQYTRPIFANRNYVNNNWNDGDALTTLYDCAAFRPKGLSHLPCTCGRKAGHAPAKWRWLFGRVSAAVECMPTRGVPTVWLAQAGFQRYHGGQMQKELTGALGLLSKQLCSIDLSSQVSWRALDTRCDLDYGALQKFYGSFAPALRRVADDTSSVPGLAYDASTYSTIAERGYTLQDAINNRDAYDYVHAALASLPDAAGFSQPVSSCFSTIASSMSAHLNMLITGYGGMSPSSTRPPEFAATEPRAIAAVVMGMDFFSQALDRRFEPGDTPVYCDIEASGPNATTAASQLPIMIPM